MRPASRFDLTAITLAATFAIAPVGCFLTVLVCVLRNGWL